MSLNPYEEATISAGFQQPSEPAVPTNKIQWGKIAICYFVNFAVYLALSFAFGLVIGVLAFARVITPQDLSESPWYYIALVIISECPLIPCVIWLVRKVRNRKFLHACILGGINLVIDILFMLAFFEYGTWLMWGLTLSQEVVILVTAAVTIGFSRKSNDSLANA